MKDFIKWLCSMADGFRMENDRRMRTSLGSFDIHYSSDYIDIYDLLLDRAIQGVNRDCSSIFIVQYGLQIVLGINNDEECFDHDGTTKGIREAREKALKYVKGEMCGE